MPTKKVKTPNKAIFLHFLGAGDQGEAAEKDENDEADEGEEGAPAEGGEGKSFDLKKEAEVSLYFHTSL